MTASTTSSPRRQLNIRSDEARVLVQAIAAETGMSITEVIEAALRDYRVRRRIQTSRVSIQEADRNRLGLLEAVQALEIGGTMPDGRS